MPEANEAWQVEVNGAIYDAAFSELPEWIDGGSLLPEDKVRKGNLRWIEARRVPSLVPFFNAKERGEPMPITVSLAEQPPAEAEPSSFETHKNHSAAAAAIPASPQIPLQANPNSCIVHADIGSFYACEGCSNRLCKACPHSYGGSVKICPLCGAMCKPISEAEEKKGAEAGHLSTGSGDLERALAHPFKFKISLFFGAGLFAIFTIGQAAAGVGGIYLIVSALFCGMLANMLKFGVLSNTVDNFIQGKLDANFMPDFENFEIWDDVIHPFFLSIAAYLVSFGPFLVTLIISFYLVVSAVAETARSIQSDLEGIPGTNVYAGRELADQSKDVKEVLVRINKERSEMGASRATAAAEAAESDGGIPAEPPQIVDQESREQEELWASATESRKQSLESVIGKTPETKAREQGEMYKAFLSLTAPLVVVGVIAFLWGAFLFPAACAVAGYSRSFMATINPLVCLDTVKRLGFDYVKILAIGILLVALLAIIGTSVAFVLSPFDLPALGNIPATGLTALFTFYLWTVFSCVIGYALFRNRDKLGLPS